MMRVVILFKGLSLTRIDVEEGVANAFPGRPVPFASISYFTSEKPEDFQAGMAARSGEVIGDMPNYTDVQSLIQINRVTAS